MLEKIDLLKYKKKRHRKKKIISGLITVFFLILGSAFVSFKLFYLPKELNANTNFFKELSHLVTSPDRDITSGKKNINILLLGMGGVGHEGPYLTDTILLVSINKKDGGKMAVTSIPRDLLVDTHKFGKKKINHLNSYAEIEEPGSGARFTRDVLEELFHIPIDYYARVDFSGFNQAIDLVDGIDVNVPRTFSDPLYPLKKIQGKEPQTTTVTFEKGMQHMDGSTALVYARSRHGNNGEGNDFARSRRGQQIILALKDKMLSNKTLLSPFKLKEILKTVQKHINTNVNAWEAIQLAKTFQKLNITPNKITYNVLTNGQSGPLYSTYYNRQYVLLPKKSDLSDMRAIANNPFDIKTKKYTGNYVGAADIRLVILNGTNIGGLAGEAALTLEDFGFRINNIKNSPEKGFEKSVVYNISTEDKKDALEEIKKILNANVAQSIPEWLKEAISKNNKPDFVVVVGQT